MLGLLFLDCQIILDYFIDDNCELLTHIKVPDGSESQSSLERKYDTGMDQDVTIHPDVILLKTATLNEQPSSSNGADLDHARAPSIMTHHEFGF